MTTDTDNSDRKVHVFILVYWIKIEMLQDYSQNFQI